MSGFRTVFLDVDSTLCGVEGIDWLAERKGPGVAREVAALTREAMEGAVPLDAVYGKRLAVVAPTRAEASALGDEYVRTVAPGATEAIRKMIEGGIAVHLISGGLAPAVRIVAAAAGIADGNVHAVEIYFGDDGGYSSYDEKSPLARRNGKRDLIASLGSQRPSLMVGDGITDAEAKPAVDSFAAFTFFSRRPQVIAMADTVVPDYDELLQLVLG